MGLGVRFTADAVGIILYQLGAGVPNDTIAGTPANNPTGPFGAPFDFTVQLTDSLGGP